MKFKEHYSAQNETKAEKTEVKKQQSSDPVVKEAMFKDKVQALKDRMRNVVPNNPYTTKKEESPPPSPSLQQQEDEVDEEEVPKTPPRVRPTKALRKGGLWTDGENDLSKALGNKYSFNLVVNHKHKNQESNVK
jgi:hypothetical protein